MAILWHWFKAYLSSRNQLVSVNHCYSGILPVDSGGATRQYFGSFSIPGLYKRSSFIYFSSSVYTSFSLMILNALRRFLHPVTAFCAST